MHSCRTIVTPAYTTVASVHTIVASVYTNVTLAYTNVTLAYTPLFRYYGRYYVSVVWCRSYSEQSLPPLYTEVFFFK